MKKQLPNVLFVGLGYLIFWSLLLVAFVPYLVASEISSIETDLWLRTGHTVVMTNHNTRDENSRTRGADTDDIVGNLVEPIVWGQGAPYRSKLNLTAHLLPAMSPKRYHLLL